MKPIFRFALLGAMLALPLASFAQYSQQQGSSGASSAPPVAALEPALVARGAARELVRADELDALLVGTQDLDHFFVVIEQIDQVEAAARAPDLFCGGVGLLLLERRPPAVDIAGGSIGREKNAAGSILPVALDGLCAGRAG